MGSSPYRRPSHRIKATVRRDPALIIPSKDSRAVSRMAVNKSGSGALLVILCHRLRRQAIEPPRLILPIPVDEVPRAVAAHGVEECFPIPEIAAAFEPEVIAGFGGEADVQKV